MITLLKSFRSIPISSIEGVHIQLKGKWTSMALIQSTDSPQCSNRPLTQISIQMAEAAIQDANSSSEEV